MGGAGGGGGGCKLSHFVLMRLIVGKAERCLEQSAVECRTGEATWAVQPRCHLTELVMQEGRARLMREAARTHWEATRRGTAGRSQRTRWGEE